MGGDFRLLAPGTRFFIVSATEYGADLGVLAALVSSGLGKTVAHTVAIIPSPPQLSRQQALVVPALITQAVRPQSGFRWAGR